MFSRCLKYSFKDQVEGTVIYYSCVGVCKVVNVFVETVVWRKIYTNE